MIIIIIPIILALRRRLGHSIADSHVARRCGGGGSKQSYGCVYIYIYKHIHMYVCMYVCIYIYIYTHTNLYLSLSLYIYIYIYAYTFIHIHTHIYLYTYTPQSLRSFSISSFASSRGNRIVAGLMLITILYNRRVTNVNNDTKVNRNVNTNTHNINKHISTTIRGPPRTFHFVRKQLNENLPAHEPLKQHFLSTKSKEVWVMALAHPLDRHVQGDLVGHGETCGWEVQYSIVQYNIVSYSIV